MTTVIMMMAMMPSMTILMSLPRMRKMRKMVILLLQAILSHLVKCIAGEVAVVRDVEAGEGGTRRHLSRTISVSGSTAKDTIVAGRDGGRDYTEINSIPPLPLYALLSADLDTSYKGGEEGAKGGKVAEVEGARKTGGDQYTDLFQVRGFRFELDVSVTHRIVVPKCVDAQQILHRFFNSILLVYFLLYNVDILLPKDKLCSKCLLEPYDPSMC